jgi:DNA modification methylase
MTTHVNGDQASAGLEIADAMRVGPRLKQAHGTTRAGEQWRVLCGDSRDAMRVLDPDSVGAIVTSPPYFWQRDYEVAGQIGHEAKIEAYVEAITSTFREARRVLSPSGLLFLNLGDTYYSAKGRPHGADKKNSGRQLARRQLRAVDGPGLGLPRKSLIGIPWRVARAMQEDGWTLRSDIIWYRPNALGEPSASDRPWRLFEHVFMFSKAPRYWFSRVGLGGDEDVWTLSSRPENPHSHFAPFPAELVERCLACGCRPGETVLDPFVGTGTTMLAALARGHSAIGIDLKREYCLSTLRRIRALDKGATEVRVQLELLER